MKWHGVQVVALVIVMRAVGVDANDTTRFNLEGEGLFSAAWWDGSNQVSASQRLHFIGVAPLSLCAGSTQLYRNRSLDLTFDGAVGFRWVGEQFGVIVAGFAGARVIRIGGIRAIFGVVGPEVSLIYYVTTRVSGRIRYRTRIVLGNGAQVGHGVDAGFAVGFWPKRR